MIKNINEYGPYATDEPREITYRGMEWFVAAHVFPPYPNFGGSSPVSERNIEMYRDHTVLDLGCGSGIRGVIAHLSGAESVVFSDLTEASCSNTAINCSRQGIYNPTIAQSNMFDTVYGAFDRIVAYLPSIDAEVTDINELSIHDPDFALHKQLIDEVGDYLEPGGVAYTAFLDADDMWFTDRIAQNGLAIDRLKSVPHKDEFEDQSWHFIDIKKP